MKRVNWMIIGTILFGIIVWGGMKLAHAEDSKADWLTRPDVQLFMARIQKEQGYSLETLKQILSGVEIQQSILDAMNHQAERKKWFEYRPIFIQQARIKGGQAFLESNRDALKKASETYGVPIEIITSIVGVETRYGQHAGRHRVVDALATLGFFYPRRSEFFQRELEHFLQLVKEQKFDITTLYGSYAGAMGVPQFIPSSYRHYAVDFDEDGRKDLFDSVSDVVGSVGNYFAQHGWKKDQLVAVKATVSGDSWKDVPEYRLQRPDMSLSQLEKYGVRPAVSLSEDLPANLLVLEQQEGPEFWLVFHNFHVITRYNRSSMYAMAVWQLSQLIGASGE